MSQRLQRITLREGAGVTEGADGLPDLKPGDLIRRPPGESNSAESWVMVCPTCGRGANLLDHSAEPAAGDTVTIRPSCVCPRPNCTAHYYVTENKIEWV